MTGGCRRNLERTNISRHVFWRIYLRSSQGLYVALLSSYNCHGSSMDDSPRKKYLTSAERFVFALLLIRSYNHLDFIYSPLPIELSFNFVLSLVFLFPLLSTYIDISTLTGSHVTAWAIKGYANVLAFHHFSTHCLSPSSIIDGTNSQVESRYIFPYRKQWSPGKAGLCRGSFISPPTFLTEPQIVLRR